MARTRNKRPVRRRRWSIAIIVIAVLIALAGLRWLPIPAVQRVAVTLGIPNGSEDGVWVAAEPPKPPSDPSTDRERLLAAAWSMQEIPYVFGAKGPDELDCSGFTKSAFDAVGHEIPHGSFNQAEGEQPLPQISELVAGDLLFYRSTAEESVSHVTMYAGEGWVIGTGSPGQPPKVLLYPITDDLGDPDRVITYRHVVLPDGS